MDERFEPLLELVFPLANRIVARTWPHEDFHKFCDQLIPFNCEDVLRNSNSQDLDYLSELVMGKLTFLIPQLSESLQVFLQNQAEVSLTAFGQQFLFRITDLPVDNM